MGWRHFLRSQQRREGELIMEVKLYVGNLSYGTTEEDLRALFAQAGNVASVALIKDRDTGRSKGFAFIEMTTQVEAQKAISMFNAYKLQDRELTVNLARPREERGRFDDRRGGGGGRGGFDDRRGGGGSKRGGGGKQRRF
jgi:RNA recognition motif-containing protein